MSILTTSKKRSTWQRFCDFFTTQEDYDDNGQLIVVPTEDSPVLDPIIQEAAALALAETYVIQYDEKNIVQPVEVKEEPAIQKVEEPTVESTQETTVEPTMEDNQ